MNKIDTLVFEGGGVHGIAYAGIMSNIKADDLLNIDTFVGTSFGSIIAGFLAFGIDPRDISKELLKVDYSKFKKASVFSFFNFFTKKSIYNSKYFRKEILRVMKKYDIDKNIKFGDLKKDLFCTVTNLTKGREETFNNYRTPNMKVINAIVASCSIPFIYEPFLWRENLYCDGGIVENYNIDQVKNGESSIGFVLGDKKLELDHVNKISGVYSYATAVLKTLINTANKKHIQNNLWNNNTIFIKIPENIDSLNFNISQKDKIVLYNAGINTNFSINIDI